jgi:hypothetical protein
MTYELWNTATANRIGSFSLDDLGQTLDEIVEAEGPGALQELAARVWAPGAGAAIAVLGPLELGRYAHRVNTTHVVGPAMTPGLTTSAHAEVVVSRRPAQVA